MFKNQLQEFCQRSSFNLPSYSCLREGPDHAPSFKAMVSLNGRTYESPGYFATLRQAEHAAAEVALTAFAQIEDHDPRGQPASIAADAASGAPSMRSAATRPLLDESSVCKNLLQETAQRAGASLPAYHTFRSGPSHAPMFTCAVDVAGLNFTGEPAKTKKQAEKNSAQAAWMELKKLARRSQQFSASVSLADRQQFDETDVIRSILRANSLQIKSSPAALTEHIPTSVMPHMLYHTGEPPSSSSVSFSHSSSSSSSSSSGSLYRPKHISRNQLPLGAALAATSTKPVYTPRHVSATWNDGIAPKFQFPNSTTDTSSNSGEQQLNARSASSSDNTAPRPVYTRHSAGGSFVGPAYQPREALSSSRANSLENHDIESALRHSNFPIRPDMAYQPRAPRAPAPAPMQQEPPSDRRPSWRSTAGTSNETCSGSYISSFGSAFASRASNGSNSDPLFRSYNSSGNNLVGRRIDSMQSDCSSKLDADFVLSGGDGSSSQGIMTRGGAYGLETVSCPKIMSRANNSGPYLAETSSHGAASVYVRRGSAQLSEVRETFNATTYSYQEDEISVNVDRIARKMIVDLAL